MKYLLITLILMSSGAPSTPREEPKTYSVNKIAAAIQLSGKGDDINWNHAMSLYDFTYPWEKEKPQPTRFRALHNSDWLYCLFEVTDSQVHILEKSDDKWEVASSSRAEIFFKINDKLTPYYCLEIDPLGRVLDYRGNYYRKFDRAWSWPAGQLIVKTHKTSDGYSIELALSKSSLIQLGLLKDQLLQAGLYRADCSLKDVEGPDFKWISWVKPDAETPDFHIPSSFGVLRLTE